MDVFNSIANYLLRIYFGAFTWAPPGVGLTVLSAGVGVVLLWVFQKTSNQSKIRTTKRLVQASLLELRIFRDEPRTVWRAQKSLLTTNLRYIGLMLVPALWAALPFAILVAHLESFYGRSPMAEGSESILTIRMRTPLAAVAPTLTTPPGVVPETPMVRVVAEQEISWRIRARAEVSGDLRITMGGETITQRLEAGGPQRFVPGRRVSSMLDAVWHPDGPRITLPSVEWIEIRYPEARVRVFGFSVHWLVWFTLVSVVSGLLLKKRFKVIV